MAAKRGAFQSVLLLNISLSLGKLQLVQKLPQNVNNIHDRRSVQFPFRQQQFIVQYALRS